MNALLHFSEDPSIELFVPRVSSLDAEPVVWAIDEKHAPSYWFPRDCPRACCWTETSRIHAMESCWLDRFRQCKLFVYRFRTEDFELKTSEAGYWVARKEVRSISVMPVGDLMQRHIEAQIDFRVVPNLWPVIDSIVDSGM